MKNRMILKGTILYAKTPQELCCCEGFVISEDGVCRGCFEVLPQEYASEPVEDFTGKLILPGMTDLHLHAPQYSFRGMAMDLELMDWLSTYTFPEEAKYGDLDYARAAYKIFTEDLLHSATTRACIFATIHTEGTMELMKELKAAGLASYVGRLNMNRNSPENYCETGTDEGMEETRRWLLLCAAEPDSLVKPILTPRFTPSVTDDYMKALGQLANEQHLPVQSHLDENPSEIEFVHELCPDAANYGDTYDRFGLFGGKVPTIMAHCVFCTEEENAKIKENGVFIAHCPTSNENLGSGISPAARYLREGYSIGLGSDVAGGHTINLFEVMTSAIQVSKLRTRYVDSAQEPLTLPEAFWMATAGGGSFFGKTGSFEAGYRFDAIVIDDSTLRSPRKLTPEERLERYAYLGDGRVTAKYIEGQRIL